MEHLFLLFDLLQEADVLHVIQDEHVPVVLPGQVAFRKRSLVLADRDFADVVQFVGRLFGEGVLAVEVEEVDDFRARDVEVAISLVNPCTLLGSRKPGHELERDLQLRRPVDHVGSIVCEVPTGQDRDIVVANLGKEPGQQFAFGLAEDIAAVVLGHLVLHLLADVLRHAVGDIVVRFGKINRYAVDRVSGHARAWKLTGGLHLNIEEAEVDFRHVGFEHAGVCIEAGKEPRPRVDVDFCKVVARTGELMSDFPLVLRMPLDGKHLVAVNVVHAARFCAELSPYIGIERVDVLQHVHSAIHVPQEHSVLFRVMVDGLPHFGSFCFCIRYRYLRHIRKYSKKRTGIASPI